MGAIKKPKDVAEAMQRIESEAIRMSGLVESLLTLTRLDELGSLNKERHNIVVLANQVVKDASVANPDVKFELETNDELIEIQIDADRIKQVLTNLVANSARFAPKDSEVRIRLHSDNERVLVQVIDHGEGIPEPLREKIFDRFYRVDNSRNRDTGGSGLGLAIASSIVINHQGKIWVSETPGGGATFEFELPSTALITKS
jgi:two-component system OmpR family sensor kinase